MSEQPFRCGMISVLGRPNAGKSTLMNALLGMKVSIVADKPQTTRSVVQGVLTSKTSQMIFLDTPGIHSGDTPINQRMMDAVREALEGRDLLVFVADASAPPSRRDAEAVSLVARPGVPVILALNKVDLVRPKPALFPVLERYRGYHDFAEYVPVSALEDDGIDTLKAAIESRLPEGPALFPEDYVTDQPERILAAEFVREQVLLATGQEVPHATTVLIERWEASAEIVRIMATIYVERPGQRAIIIGKGGERLKQIGIEARREIERLLGVKVFLETHVRVEPDWRRKPAFLNSLDWRTMRGLGNN